VILRRELPISTVCRLGISYQSDTLEPDWPRSLFLKLPRVLSESTGMVPGDHRSEVEFYREVAPRIGCPPIIRCYDAAYSEESKRSHIVLDDLMETHMQPQQEHAPSPEMSRLAVAALARVHAAWWNHAISDLGSGISDVGAEDDGLGGRFDDEALRKFVENLNKNVAEFSGDAELTEKQKDAYHLMLAAADRIWGRMTRQDHLTVTHGDMHWWNFLYPKDPRTHAVHIFDWQLCHIDLGARDLAFLLALGGFAEPRPEMEEELLRVYHETLGVPDYSWNRLIEDYRWSAIRNLNIPVIYWAQGKHESTWRTALQRAFEAYKRLDCRSLIVDRCSLFVDARLDS
jgi:hypothetical protein